MTTIDLPTLTTILRESAGEEMFLDGDILDVPFDELGYDSLVLLETAGRLARDFGIRLGDEEFEALETPRDLLERVNAVLAGR